MDQPTIKKRRSAFQFIIVMGLVSLLGDITYEGARSVTGPFLAILGASAGVVGLVAGIGEFSGYALRLLSGYLSDRTRQYWIFTILGYGMLLSVPLLAFAGYWHIAALLIIMERMGKGLRTPARDAILSYAAFRTGRGVAFGLHEALDQIGAIIGPLIFTLVFLMHGGYREGFSLLWIPFVLCMITLLIARKQFPHPEEMEDQSPAKEDNPRDKGSLPRLLYLYMGFIFFSVMGLVHFQIIAYHFQIHSIITEAQISLFYAIAMGVDALFALLIGRIYDRLGLITLIAAPLLTLPIPFMIFSDQSLPALIAVLFWGSVLGIHETIMRAAIGDLVPARRRGFAYGIFNTIYGLSWFVGSLVIGILYDLHRVYLIAFVVGAELISLSILVAFRNSLHASNH